ncbi:MAG: iron uptake system component EfeO [Solirubrobacteraceae bacterium]|nr:iron uptake system component EfeO [Solirubrobacteraceae bacterium]
MLHRPIVALALAASTVAFAACGGSEDPAPASAPKAADPRLSAAVTGYHGYVVTQARELHDRTARFVAAVKAGDVAAARRLFAAAREPWEKIEPVAESFGALDPEIDARVNDVAAGDRWTGFHRIERALWKDGSTRGMGPIADKLLADVTRLQGKVRRATYEPEQLAIGATELLAEVSATKISGEEDRYSHADLWDIAANVAGAQAAFDLLAPALRSRDAALAQTVTARFAAVRRALRATQTGGRYPRYDTVGQAQRRRLSQLVDALAEPLSQVAGRLRS